MIVLRDNTETISFANSEKDVVLKNTYPFIVFNVITDTGTGFPYIFPYILS